MKRRSLVFGLLAMTMICAGSLERAVWADSKGNFPGKGSVQAYKTACRLNDQANRLAEAKDLKGAVKLSQQCVAIYPFDSGFYHNLACSLSDLKLFDDAIQAENRATNLEPNYEGAWIKKGFCYEDLGRLDEAEKCYRKAESISSDVETCFALADLLKKKKQFSGAKTWYLKAKSRTSDHEQLVQIDDRLKKLKPMLEASH